MLGRKPYGVKLPQDLFVLRYDDEGTPPEGPWLPEEAVVNDDGSVALLSDGLPVVLRVARQRGDKITLDDGTVMFFASA